MHDEEPVRWAPPVEDRVRGRTSVNNLQRIDDRTRGALISAAIEPRSARALRLWELDHEWDVDRALMATFSVVGSASAALSVWRSLRARRPSAWLGLFGAQAFFLCYYAVRGWCPPLPVLRRLGFRTQKEIDAERVAVEAMLES